MSRDTLIQCRRKHKPQGTREARETRDSIRDPLGSHEDINGVPEHLEGPCECVFLRQGFDRGDQIAVDRSAARCANAPLPRAKMAPAAARRSARPAGLGAASPPPASRTNLEQRRCCAMQRMSRAFVRGAIEESKFWINEDRVVGVECSRTMRMVESTKSTVLGGSKNPRNSGSEDAMVASFTEGSIQSAKPTAFFPWLGLAEQHDSARA